MAELRAAEAAVRVAEAELTRAMLADKATGLARKAAAVAIPSAAAGSECSPVTPPRQRRAQARAERFETVSEGAAAVAATADSMVSQLDNGWKQITTRRKRGNRRDHVFVLAGGQADGQDLTVRSRREMQQEIATRAQADDSDADL